MTSGSSFIPEGIETEPILLLDRTGSMNYPNSAEDQNTSRKDVVREAISLIVEELAVRDSQAGHEAEGGGLLTFTFANGEAEEVGDLNPNNLDEKWKHIHWAGGTYIMPGWREVVQAYNEEFGSRPADQRPLLLTLIITDGEAADNDAFERTIAQAKGGVYIVIALLGYGAEHDKAERAYNQIAQNNPAHVKVLSFANETNPQNIASALLEMIA